MEAHRRVHDVYRQGRSWWMGDEAMVHGKSLPSLNSSCLIGAEGHLHLQSDGQPADWLATGLMPAVGPSALSGHFLSGSGWG